MFWMAKWAWLWGLIAMLGLAACGPVGARENERVIAFEWLPSESAPRLTPMHLLRGDLELTDGSTSYVPDKRLVSNGWGEIGSTHLVGPARKALPRAVALTWFSLLEDRFYAGRFTLPVDRIATLMDQGAALPPPRGRQPYDRIVFGMAPGGHVSVWVSTGEVVTEVARFVAGPAEVPWSEFLDNPDVSRAQYIRENLEAVLKPEGLKHVSSRPDLLTMWSDAGRRLPWRPQLAGTSAQGAIVWVKGLNGERNWIDLADPAAGGIPPQEPLSMPDKLLLNWQAAAGQRLSADIAFDSAEVLAAFKKLSAADRPGAMTLMLEPSPTGDTVDVFLRRGELAYRFKNTKVEVFGAD